MASATLTLGMLTFEHSNRPVAFARELLGFEPDAAQAQLLEAKDRYVILNCHRQWGKTTITAVHAVHRALSRPGQTIVILSLTLPQAQVLASRCRMFARKMGVPVKSDATKEHAMVFPNGSVIFPLPAVADRVRGYTANLLIVDEAACVKDEVFAAATPMLAATNGDSWLLSTPKGRQGFFYEARVAKDTIGEPWRRIAAAARTNGRVSVELLERERGWKTEEEFRKEFECEFASGMRNVFAEEWLEKAFAGDIPVFDEMSRADLQFERHPPAYYLSADDGKVRNHAALVLLEYRTIYTGMRNAATLQYLYRRELRVVLVEQFRLGSVYRNLVARLRSYAGIRT